MQTQIAKFSSLIQYYWISFPCSKYFVWDCLSKQIFGHNSTQSPPNFNYLTFSITATLFFCFFNKNIKQLSCVKVLNLMVCVGTILHVLFRSKLDFRKLSTLLLGSLLIELTFLSQISAFFRNLNDHWKCRNKEV